MDDSLIRQMFSAIDSADWMTLATIFHPEATYERPGYEPLVGRDRLMHFYQNERAVASSRHVIEGTLVEKGKAAAWGSMSGVLTDGKEVAVQFAEVYRFADNAIERRRSYFFTPTV